MTSLNPLASRVEHLFGKLSKVRGTCHLTEAIQWLGFLFSIEVAVTNVGKHYQKVWFTPPTHFVGFPYCASRE